MISQQSSAKSVYTPDTVEFDPFAGPAIATAIPSTEPQREIWTATQIGDDASLAFNESTSLRLRGPLDRGALNAAVRALVARHEALRSSFSGDGLSMMIQESLEAEPTLHDFAALTPDAARGQLDKLLKKSVEEPFDLVDGPLVRFDLVVLAPQEHVLVITAHHIICDGWSFGVIGSDLAALYSSCLRGENDGLAAPERFSAYSKVQDAEGSPELEAAEHYWLKQFEAEAPILDLPADRARPALKTYSAAREDRELSPDLVRRLKESGAKQNASLFAMLFAGFGTLMHRLSGQEDIVVGIPTAGQAATGFTRLVGHCVNMLPLRIQVASGMPFAEVVSKARTTMLDGLDNQQVTLGSLLRKLPIARDPSRLPLVSVIINLEKAAAPEAMKFSGLEAEMRANPRSYETFDIFVNAVEVGKALVLECQYNTDLFDRETISRWLANFEILLDGVAQSMKTEVGLLPLLSEADLKAFERCNAPMAKLDPSLTVHGLIEAQAALSPDAIAIECDGKTISYLELDARANQLARHLRALGVDREVLVGLCVSRSIDMIVGLLGILKAGGGYVPLDPEYPKARLDFMASDSSMRVLITEEKVRTAVELDAPHVVSLDRDAAAIARESAAPLTSDESQDNEHTAYVIYTSGSTGKPKGVLVPHRSVVNLLQSVRSTPGMSHNDVVLAITTLSFDIAVSELILPLTVGARIVIASRDVSTDGLRLMELIERSGVSFIDATPATYRLLLAAGWKGSKRLRVICTGEAMPRDLADVLPARASEVWNGYGPTETTVWATFYQIPSEGGPVLIGKPIANTVAHVLDARMHPVPVGVRGELFIGGAGVAKGYLNRPELNRDRFLADPSSSAPNALLYKTGDVVRLLADGNLECLGRTDSQVKVRGFRIELGEIENGLMEHPAIVEAAVTVREDRPGDVRLVAYLVGATDEQIGDADLRTFLGQALPGHMVPQGYVWVPVMPLTPSGKIDRKALAAIATPKQERADFVEPRTPTERMLEQLWKEALGIGRVSVHDDFFTLGGHSLLASQLLSRLRHDHGIVLSFRKIFEAPTIEKLAAVVDAQLVASPAVASLAIPHRDGATTAPLSILQERLILLEELDPATRPTHGLTASWRFRGPLDVARLERVLADFVQRHELMRTAFPMVDGVRTQVVMPSAEIRLEREDLSALEPSERDATLAAFLTEQQDFLFDIETAPLFRATLVQFGPDDNLLFTNRHGLIWDGWCFDIFVNEIAELYDAYCTGRAPVLSALPVTYGDFAAWQREWLKGPEMAEQVAWWRQHLGLERPTMELPTDRRRVGSTTYRGGRTELTFTAEEIDALRAFALDYGATLFALIFAAYNVLLHRYTGQTDVMSGTPVRARTLAETENVLGPFVNTVMVRTCVEPNAPFTDILKQVREVALDAFSRQEMPLELLGGKPPVLRTIFSMQDARGRASSTGPLAIQQVHLPQTYATNDLCLWAMEGKSKTDQMLLVLNYSTELFDGSTAHRFLRQLREILFAVTREPTVMVGAIDVIPPEERAILMNDLESEPAAAAMPSPLELFDAFATADPEAVAVSNGGWNFTYGELAQRSSGVANALRTIIGTGSPVAICASGVSRVAAVLGVLRAGASAILLNPEDPPAYLAAVYAASGATASVVDEPSRDDLPDAAAALPIIVLDEAGKVQSSPAASGRLQGREARVASILHAPDAAGGAFITEMSHDQLAHLIDDLRASFSLTAKDRWVAGMSAGADSELLTMLVPLVSGARLVLASDDAMASHDTLGELLEQVGATGMIAPISAWRGMMDEGWSGAPGFGVVMADGPVEQKEVASLLDSDSRVFSAYADPKTGIWSALHAVTAEDQGLLMGKPLGLSRYLVLNEFGQAAPLGVPGILHRRTESGTQVCVGVRARRRATGTFELVANDENQTQIDGRRAAFAAIERALLTHSGLSTVAVREHRDLRGSPRLVAYIVPARRGTLTETELRAAVRRSLPRSMAPHLVVEMEALPLNESGSVERRLLATPYLVERAAGSMTAPRTDAEHVVGRVWSELLGVERISISDNFFELGGFSLLCFRGIERIQRETGARLNPRVFLTGTLEQVAAALQSATSNGSSSTPASAGIHKNGDSPKGRAFSAPKDRVRAAS